ASDASESTVTSSSGLAVALSSTTETVFRVSVPQLATDPRKWIGPPGAVASVQNLVTRMQVVCPTTLHTQAGRFAAGGNGGHPPQAPTPTVTGVVAVSPLCWNVVPATLTLPPVQLSRVITPRLATGGSSLKGGMVSSPVGRTSPAPFCQLRLP